MRITEQTAARLRAVHPELPPDKALKKASQTVRGVMFVLLGTVCFGGAFAFVIWMTVKTKGSPTVAVLIFAALLAIPGAYLLFAGGHLISGEAMDAAEHSGNIIARTAAKALKLARGNPS